RTYGAWGVDARAERYGTWKGWRRGVTHLDLVAPRVRTLEAMMLAWSPGTKGKAVQGRVVILPDLADSAAYAAWLRTVKGAFVLLSPANASCRPADNWKEFGQTGAADRVAAERRAQAEAWNARLRKTGYDNRTGPLALGSWVPSRWPMPSPRSAARRSRTNTSCSPRTSTPGTAPPAPPTTPPAPPRCSRRSASSGRPTPTRSGPSSSGTGAGRSRG